jgi:ABC-2 type transport system ATP-binding protein
MHTTLALSVTDLKKSFDKVEAVKSISLKVKPGEVLGIVGPNGAGKTTTIKMILGLLTPDKGEVSLFGESNTLSHVRARIGYMPENPSFYNHLTGRELITFAGELFDMPKDALKKRADELLKLVGLQKAADRQLAGYSKGMLQRICLAQALVNKPEILFLDEPLDGLDPLGRIQMREILEDVKKSGTAIILNSHILSDVAAVSDSIAVMYQGNLIAHGLVDKLVPKGQTLEDVFLKLIAKEEV